MRISATHGLWKKALLQGLFDKTYPPVSLAGGDERQLCPGMLQDNIPAGFIGIPLYLIIIGQVRGPIRGEKEKINEFCSHHRFSTKRENFIFPARVFSRPGILIQC